MIERSDPHWGAIVFTLVVGAMILSLITTPIARQLLVWAGPVPMATVARPTPAPTDRPAPPALSVRAPRPDELGARWLRQSASPVIHVGQVTTIAILFRNTGSVPWVRGSPAEARLGIVAEDRSLFDLGMAVDWSEPTRPAVQDEQVVPPGGTAQFSFRVKGTTAGRYVMHVMPVVDGVAWMWTEGTPIDVTVR
jgi:hypothetical protein